jgi:hypothetical protein
MAAILHQNKPFTVLIRYFIAGVRNCYICSFTEFYPFCRKLYYFSTFKAFEAAAA